VEAYEAVVVVRTRVDISGHRRRRRLGTAEEALKEFRHARAETVVVSRNGGNAT